MQTYLTSIETMTIKVKKKVKSSFMLSKKHLFLPFILK